MLESFRLRIYSPRFHVLIVLLYCTKQGLRPIQQTLFLNIPFPAVLSAGGAGAVAERAQLDHLQPGRGRGEQGRRVRGRGEELAETGTEEVRGWVG